MGVSSRPFRGEAHRVGSACQVSSKSQATVGQPYPAPRSGGDAGFHRGFRAICAARLGWSEAAINTIQLYEGKNDRLTFPTYAEFTSAVSDHLADDVISAANVDRAAAELHVAGTSEA